MKLPWKFAYYGKNLAQKVVGSIPGAYQVQEYYKHLIGHYEKRVPDQYQIQRLNRNIDRFSRNQLPPPKVVLEQGTGWDGLDLVTFYLAGAQKIYTFDTMPWLAELPMIRAIRIALDNVDVICKWKGVDTSVLAGRIQALSGFEKMSRDELLNLMHIDYRIRKGFTYDDIDAESVDFFYTYSVLQRVHLTQIDELFRNAFRLLRPGGVCCHRIHTKDFHSITDDRIPGLYYLSIPERRWACLTSRFVNYQNRLRFYDFSERLVQAGFGNIRTDEMRVNNEDIMYVEENLAERFPQKTAHDVAVWQVDLYGSRV